MAPHRTVFTVYQLYNILGLDHERITFREWFVYHKDNPHHAIQLPEGAVIELRYRTEEQS